MQIIKLISPSPMLILSIITLLATCGDDEGGGEVTDGDNTRYYSTPAISAGGTHTCAVTNTGGVVCWGNQGYGRLGNNRDSIKNAPVDVVDAKGSTTPLASISEISSGDAHTCAVTNAGGVVCWGRGSDGQLGNEDTASKEHPTAVVNSEGSSTPLANITKVSSGSLHTCAVTNAGGVVCWGDPNYGRLGNDGISKEYPVGVVDAEGSTTPLANITQISSGRHHTCAVTNTNGVVCWGRGDSGQLGNDDTSDTDAPVDVVVADGSTTPLANITQINSGGSHTCALTSTGGVVCWGDGGDGQLGNDGTASKEHPVAVVNGDGSTTPLANITQVSSGSDHSCALTSAGGVVCWGDGGNGRLGNDGTASKDHPVNVVEADGSSTPLANITQISSGDAHTCAVTNAKGVVCWGHGGNGKLGNDGTSDADAPVAVVDGDGSSNPLANITQVSSGAFHTCAVTNTGGVVCWGYGGRGQLGNDGTSDTDAPVAVVNGNGSSTPLANITKISSGNSHTCALTSSNAVVCWGYGGNGRLGNGDTASRDHPVAVVDGEGSSTPLADITQISSGSEHTCALTNAKGVVCWGLQKNGQLGNDGIRNTGVLVDVVEAEGSTTPLANITQVSSGSDHSCALTSTGGVVCWGRGNDGELGNDGTSDTDAPVAVVNGEGSTTPLANITQISSGSEHTCALTNSGGVVCWGYGDSGQLGNDGATSKDHPVVVVDGNGSTAPLANITQISSGEYHTCALTSTNTVVCWGSGFQGQLGNDGTASKNHPENVVDAEGSTTPLANIIQIRSGRYHTCAVTNTGGVVCWGDGAKGQLGDDGGNGTKVPVAVVEAEGSTTPLANIAQISSGSEHTCALTNTGGVVCWGYQESGRLGNDDTAFKDHPVVVVDAEGSSTPLANIAQISSGGEHTCALTSTKGVVCWGYGGSGRLGNDGATSKGYPVTVVDGEGSTTPLANITQISLGRYHTCALTNAGGVVCWGDRGSGQLGNDDDDSLEVVAGEGNTTTPLADIAQISSGDAHTCALTNTGGVKCWGYGDFGQLGNDGGASEKYPVAVVEAEGSATPLANIAQISSGGLHTCAVTNTGGVKCWGEGDNGQLGNDGTAPKDYPVDVVDGEGSNTPLANITQVSLGDSHTCALTNAGGVVCWGDGGSGQLGNKDTRNTNVPVAVVDGEGSGNPLANITQISSGEFHTCALTNAGGIKCWGEGDNGQLGNDDTAPKDYPVDVVVGEGSTTAFDITAY